MAYQLINGRFQAFTDAGAFAVGYQLYTYDSGTTTPKATYTDATLASVNTNPVVLDARGEAQVWLGPGAYTLVLKDASGVTVWTVDGVVDVQSATETAVDARFSDLSATGPSKGAALIGFALSAVGAATRTVMDKLADQVNVLDFGAVGDGVTDDTAAFNAAITYCRSNKRKLRVPAPSAFYSISSTLVLASDTLAPVDICGERPQWYGDETCEIRGNFNGPLIQANGTASAYATAPQLQNLTLRNLNAGVNACAVRSDYSGGLRLEWVRIQTRNYGVYSAVELISPVFIEVCIDTDAGATNSTGIAGYKLAARNAKIIGGRVYAQAVAIDYSGDMLMVMGTNVEFSQTIFRHGPMSAAVFIGCHFESSQVLVTNAVTIPTNFDGNWADNGSAGSAITGAVSFVGCHVAFGSNARSNLAVIKTTSSFVYSLEFRGCTIAVTNAIIGSSFTPATQVALPSGTKFVSVNTNGLTVVKPPSDPFSSFEIDSATGGLRQFDKISANTATLVAPTLGKQTSTLNIANGSTVDLSTGLGAFTSAVYEFAWRASSSGYEYAATVPAVQSYNVMTQGSRLSAIGAGSADAHWTVSFPAAGTIRLTNNSGSTRDVTTNFFIKHILV